jgi:BirA family biotin operon repressor/biotin-[acetyl-CoA-carboxylase] ligase
VSELLDREKILSAMTAQARAQVHGLSIALETTSTQADAMAAPAPLHGCSIFFAERQTAGQGRRGRTWASPAGANLYVSVSRRFQQDLSALTGLSLAVGVATAESLNFSLPCRSGFSRDSSSRQTIGVKWPNDLVANGRKLGGILIQLRSDAGPGSAAVIGIGINVSMPVADGEQIDQPWCDLSQLGFINVSRNTLAANLLNQLLPAMEHFERDGLSSFLPRWQQLDALAGKIVRVFEGPRVHEGISMGVTETGALRLRQGEQERAFHSGEVSLRNA